MVSYAFFVRPQVAHLLSFRVAQQRDLSHLTIVEFS